MKAFLERVLAPLLLFALSVGVRALPYPTVITERRGIQPFGNDAYYHLRRIQYALQNPGEFLEFDRYLNFPHGAHPIWSPAFDWLLTHLVRFTTPAGDQVAMEHLLMWVPPVLGGFAVVALYFVARQHFSGKVAIYAASLLAVLPSHFWYSQIGFVDHHVAEAFVTTLLLGAAMALFSEQPKDASPSARALRRAAWLGVGMGSALLLWPGCLLQVATLQLLFGIRALISPTRAAAVAWARVIAFAHAAAFFVVVPFFGGEQWLLWGDFSPVVGSNFQPLWLAVCALGFGLLSEWWQRGDAEGGVLDRALSALALAAIALGIAFWAIPELSRGALQSWGWFSKGEAFQASVAESAPLLRAPASRVQELFTHWVYLTPLAFAWLAWERRREARPAFWFLLGWACVLCLATLMQRRFMNSTSVAYSLVWVLVLAAVFDRLAFLRAARRPIFILAVGFAVWPSIASYGVDLANLQAAGRGEEPYLGLSKRELLLKASAATWIRRLTPETRGFFDSSVEPEYSVLTPWDDGHVVKYRGRRPVNVDNFGDDLGEENFHLAEQYFQAPNEDDAVEILKKIGARYVLASGFEVRRVGGYGLRSMFARLSLPMEGPRRKVDDGGRARELQVVRLVHHRLIFETVPFDGKPGEDRSFYKLYELVKGARVEGAAPPGTVVEARLVLSPHFGGELLFATAAHADETGRYSLTLPYSNEVFSAAMRVEDSYSLRSTVGSARVRVSEDDVDSGRLIEAPPLRQ